jgi:hypothetical protein
MASIFSKVHFLFKFDVNLQYPHLLEILHSIAFFRASQTKIIVSSCSEI